MKRTASGGVVLGLGLLLGVPSTGHAKPYKGAEILSSQSYRYGRIEVRMRMARGSGLLSTFFTYKTGSEVSGTFWEEIDIEVLGKDNAVAWQSNIITGQGTKTTSEQVHTHTASLADAYHTYTLEWTPDAVVWKFDGAVVRQTMGGQAGDLTNPQSLRFNIWAANIAEWVGAFSDSVLPQYQFVNFISYSRYEGGQFIQEWTDNFDSFDGGRWARADWTFAENLADFDPNNVVVRDGTLILALTREGQTGFNGTVPVDGGGNVGGAGGTSGGGGSGAAGAGTSGAGNGGTPGSGGSGVGGAGTSGSGAAGASGSGGVGGGVGGSGVGGSGATAGTTPMGGAGGAAVTGGTSSSGGTGATGGAPGSGGSASGGISGSGGVVSTGGAAPTAGNGSGAGTSGIPDNASAEAPSNDGACGCRVVGERSPSSPLAAMGLLALVLSRRGRRPRPTRRTG